MMNKTNDIERKMKQNLKHIMLLKKDLKNSDVSIDKSVYIRNMRFFHGDSILVFFKYKQNLAGMQDISQEDSLTLSICDSILYAMSSDIEKCEKMLYGNNNSSDGISNSRIVNKTNVPQYNSNTLSALPVSNPKKQPIVVTSNITKNGTEELKISGIDTSTEIAPQKQLINRMQNRDTRIPVNIVPKKNNESLTDIIDNLNTSEAKRLLETPVRPNQSGGADNFSLNSPTFVYYWANWCPACKAFKSQWGEIEKVLSNKYPNLQVHNMDIGNDKNLQQLAERVGVVSFPSLVLFANNKYNKYEGPRTTDDIVKFIKNGI